MKTNNYSGSRNEQPLKFELLGKTISRYSIKQGVEIKNYKFKENNGKFTFYMDFKYPTNIKDITNTVVKNPCLASLTGSLNPDFSGSLKAVNTPDKINRSA